jgi:UDP-glucose 4-epimerase
MKVLVTGAAGRLGRILVSSLHDAGHEVLGIDRRPLGALPAKAFETDLLKRSAEDVFRVERPEVVVHSASVTQLDTEPHDRYRVNLVGTQAVFERSARYGVKQAIFVGRHTYYGASADSPLYHTEDEPPLGLETFPELADLVAADLYAGSMLWRAPRMLTTVLRFVYTLGPSRTGTLAEFLRAPRVPRVLGFDPLVQFMHEQDAARAVLKVIDARVKGVFNVAGPGPLPLSVLIRAIRRTSVPLPESLVARALGRFGLPELPRRALSHIKYPLVIDDSRFRATTGFEHQYGQLDTLAAFRDG